LKPKITIIGAGIVGLATGLKIKELNPFIDLQIIDKEPHVSAHQSGHNSGVIHSGLYYKTGSLKALNCTRGYDLLIKFCNQEGIPFDICGKIVVATTHEQVSMLDTLITRGRENGLKGIVRMTIDALKEVEPHVAGVEGIKVPQTGIVDYRMVANKMRLKLEKMDTRFCLGERVMSLVGSAAYSEITTSRNTYHSHLVINCGGLFSDKLAEMAGEKVDLKIIPFRGEYFTLKRSKEGLVNNLIYPVPDPSFPFLGVHFTRMIRGGIEAGPNAVLAYRREGYSKNDINLSELFETIMWPGFQKVAKKYWKTGLGELYRSYSKKGFTRALQQLIPEITMDDLARGGSGVRAQACDRHGGLIDDFVIRESKQMIHVLNAPSPAATSSLAIGETVAGLAMRHLE